jgi:hypothetical protein
MSEVKKAGYKKKSYKSFYDICVKAIEVNGDPGWFFAYYIIAGTFDTYLW